MKLKQFLTRRRLILGLIVAATITIYILSLWAFGNIYGIDMAYTLIDWHEYIAQRGFDGINSIYTDNPGRWGADYPSTYYLILYIFSRIPIFDGIITVKLISAIFTLAGAVLIYFIVKHFRPKSNFAPVLAACGSTLLPIVFLETIILGQCDIIFSVFILASWLAVLKQRPWLAWTMFGIAVSFKLMAVFFLPFLIYQTARNWRSSKLAARLSPLGSILAVAAVSLPGIIAGNLPFGKVLDIYFDRLTTHSLFESALVGGGGGAAVNVWKFNNDISLKYLAIAVAGLLTLAVAVFIWKFVRPHKPAAQRGIDGDLLLLSTATILPFTLPFMLDRYLFLAAVLSYVICFKHPNQTNIIIAAILNYVVFWMNDIYFWVFLAGHYTSPLVPPPMGLILLTGGLIIYMFYLMYKNSTLYGKRKNGKISKAT
jgi:hypothetical protein